MMKTLSLSILALALAACGGSDDHGVSTDPNAATGFITSNSYVPETADNTNDDGTPRDGDGRPYTYAFLGKPLPNFNGQTLGESTFNSADIDQWTVIDVWGMWCGDCIADAPFVSEAAARIALIDDLDFISVHTPPSAARADEAFGKYGSVERYFDVQGYSYPTVVDTDASIRDILQIRWTPSYLLVSPDGIVRGYRTDLSVAGDTPVDDFLADIETVRAKHAGIKPRIRKASIGESGTPGISGITPFSFASVEASFPEHQVTTTLIKRGEETYPVFNVFEEEKSAVPIYTIWPNWDRGHVGIITSRSANIEGPHSTQIGQTLFGELPKSESEKCIFGSDDEGEIIVCITGENRQFQYIFELSNVDKDTALDTASSDVKDRAVLKEFRYILPTPVN